MVKQDIQTLEVRLSELQKSMRHFQDPIFNASHSIDSIDPLIGMRFDAILALTQCLFAYNFNNS